jgi:hypothetical protein
VSLTINSLCHERLWKDSDNGHSKSEHKIEDIEDVRDRGKEGIEDREASQNGYNAQSDSPDRPNYSDAKWIVSNVSPELRNFALHSSRVTCSRFLRGIRVGT